ncbi:MAG: carboxylesterase family protein [Candidatus Lokiarchaeota archaeon]|nr:carboxylesterase family protein [Candidatus Lokiarchaeota archaeon]MBD3198522.1 carboxylesterase family protein [Candidatus Lokiarchaeota archaeon]
MSVVNTKTGKIEGYKEREMLVFKGIPYAKPPTGELRFAPPVEVDPWSGTLNAENYKSCPYQGFSQLEEWFGKLQPESEDCLNLNIWTPACDEQKRPVMVWIHGGAFITGGGINPAYEGLALAKKGNMVVLTINYRLGAFGYLYIPGKTVNVGLLDQVMALKWVRENIEHFGGDPDNITIFGESAGGYSVVSLPVVPAAKGLFHRVIAQSAPFIDPEVSDKNTKGFMRILKLKKDDLEGLRKISPEEIIAAQNTYMQKDPTNILAFRPIVDGKIIPKHPLKAFRNGECKNIDLMIGTNLDEAKLFTALEPTLNQMIEKGGENALIMYMNTMNINKEHSKEIIETYRKARQGKLSVEPVELFDAILTDVMFRIPSIRLAEAQSQHNENTYSYIFTYKSPQFDGKLGSPHAIEIPFVFNTLDNQNWGEFIHNGTMEQEISQKVMDAWIGFAHTGNPNNERLPQWPRYDKKERATMMLGNECEIINAPFDIERKAWKGLLKI